MPTIRLEIEIMGCPDRGKIDLVSCMARIKYREGDWFGVPLRPEGYGLGVVARANPRGVLFGYFFGPKQMQVPALSDAASLLPEEAVLVGMFGHLGITSGKWPLLGQLAGWQRDKWAMPEFCRYEELTGRSFRVTYAPDDPNKVIREDLVEPGVAEQLPKDRLMGAGAAEVHLTALLRDSIRDL
jgi:hypothetical protein